MIDPKAEAVQTLLDGLAYGRIDRRRFLELLAAAGLNTYLSGAAFQTAAAAEANQRNRRNALRAEYDYLIVGAGAAGCVIAAKLASTGAQVLLLEAGGDDDLPQIHTPGIWFTNLGGPLDWRFSAAADSAVAGRRVPIAMGHVLGGGTSINAMLWVRGVAADFDGWAAGGCTGWAFKDLLSIFRRIEDWEGGANEWRGAGGPIPIRTARNPHPTAQAFIEACPQMGIPILQDVNGPMREGGGYVNMTIAADGTRASAARCFLRPALNLPNLTLLLNESVTDLRFKATRCTGVRTLHQGVSREFRAAREVIVTAGGLGSAKLLMLSGVGNADHLRTLGIAPVVDLKGVGQNFQDHPLLCGVVFKYKGAMPPRPLSSNAVEAAAYVRSSSALTSPDIKLVLQQLPLMTPEIKARYGDSKGDAFTISPALVRPSSRGTLRLQSARWQDEAVLQANFLGTDEDLRATVRCIEMCRELGAQAGFNEVRESEAVPGRPLARPKIEEFARLATISFGHPVGTCKMGLDEASVVDPLLKVHGIEGLRVADSSVMPRIITGPTSAPTHVIAAKAADLIAEDL